MFLLHSFSPSSLIPLSLFLCAHLFFLCFLFFLSHFLFFCFLFFSFLFTSLLSFFLSFFLSVFLLNSFLLSSFQQIRLRSRRKRTVMVAITDNSRISPLPFSSSRFKQNNCDNIIMGVNVFGFWTHNFWGNILRTESNLVKEVPGFSAESLCLRQAIQ